MEILKVAAKERAGLGKSYVRKLRSQGWIPAAYYGHAMETRHIEINVREFGAILRSGKVNHLIDLQFAGESGESLAVVKEVQHDVLTPGHLLHVDFLHVAMGEKVTVECPVEIVGTPVGVKDEGGVMEQPTRSLTVECLPGNMPEHISVDVSELHIGDSVHAEDVSAPEGVTITTNPSEVIVAVHHAAKEEAAPEAGEAAAEGEGAEGAQGAAEEEAAAE